MKREDIYLRDPFILPYKSTYYLYGTKGETSWGIADRFEVFKSSDLESWDGPFTAFKRPDGFWADRHFWAPEVYIYNDLFYMFASFFAEDAFRGTQILVADNPIGPFGIHSNGPVTPKDWNCLDGSLYIDKLGKPWMVFCHEWTQIKDGTICAIRLSDDLKNSIGDPIELFNASSVSWVKGFDGNYITDGPFLLKRKNSSLIMIWSSLCETGYALGIARASEINGPWVNEKLPLFTDDGGHGMIFKDFNGKMQLIIHYPNVQGKERPFIIEIADSVLNK